MGPSINKFKATICTAG